LATACGGADEVVAAGDGAQGLSAEGASTDGAPRGGASRDGSASDAKTMPGPVNTIESDASMEVVLRNQEIAEGLKQARLQWASRGNSDYQVHVKRSCFCAPRLQDDVLVEVEANRVVAAFGLGASGEYDTAVDTEKYGDWYTVAGMFKRIESNIGSAANIGVEYDPSFGYPAQVALDYWLLASEEGEVFHMSDFVSDADVRIQDQIAAGAEH
jgi:hypothetical protein